MLKVSANAGISWDTRYNAYIVAWLESFHKKSKLFSISKFDIKEIALKAAEKYIKEVVNKKNEYTKHGDVVEIMVKDYYNLANKIKRLHKGFTSGIEFSLNINIDIDAYALGYWLGDGTSRDPGITTAEPEIVEYFTSFAKKNDMVFKRAGNSKYGYYLRSNINDNDAKRNNIFINFMKKYNLVNNKHIPADYMYNSRSNRLKLLAGLVDSDGHYSSGGYDFTFKSEKLTDDVIFLARTLGFNAYKAKVQKTCTNSIHGRITGTYYRFFVHGEGLDKVPSILNRKMANKRKQIKNASVTGLTILNCNTDICYELVTDSDEMLMLEDFTIVHK